MTCNDQRREQIADLATSRLETESADELLEHFAVCAPCSAEFDLVADLVHAQPAFGARQQDRPIPWGLGLAAAAAILVSLVLWTNLSGAPEVRDLAQLTPIPAGTALLRGDPGDRGEAFVNGIRAYERRDYAAAAEHLRAATAASPDDALALLYLGIAELQTGSAEAATEPLRRAGELGSGLVAERALWFLANARLHLDEAAAATQVLERLRDLDGDYAANAEALLREIARR